MDHATHMKSTFQDIVMITKARLCLLALLMASIGYFISPQKEVDWMKFFWMLIGTALVGASSGVFNQFIEKEVDGLMERTKNRPLPQKRFSEQFALVLGYSCGIVGECLLLVFVNTTTALLGAITLLVYLGIYTPSKRVSPLSTLVGTIPGALPPLMGWTAANGSIGQPGIFLFLLLILWQIPHFLAIAWIYREDYERGGFPILSVVDQFGAATGRQIILYCIVLVPLSLVPSVWGITGNLYLWGALGLSTLFLLFGSLLAFYRTIPYARKLFYASIIYLPLIGLLMVFDKRG